MSDLIAFVIEDEIDLADIFSESLRAAGFQPEILNNGTLAQKRLTEVVPDIIVLDLHLPGMDGDQLLKLIRDDERMVNTKVIVTTADHNMAVRLSRRPNLVLLKPISFSQLRDLSLRLKDLKPNK